MSFSKMYVAMALAAYAMNAQAIKPEPVPVELIQGAEGAVIFYKGYCQSPSGQELCIFAEKNDVLWVFNYTADGILYKVSTVVKEVETVRWLHSLRGT